MAKKALHGVMGIRGLWPGARDIAWSILLLGALGLLVTFLGAVILRFLLAGIGLGIWLWLRAVVKGCSSRKAKVGFPMASMALGVAVLSPNWFEIWGPCLAIGVCLCLLCNRPASLSSK